jgi:hypothetical protein
MGTNIANNTALVLVDARTSARNIYLPYAYLNSGRSITFKDKYGAAGSNLITIQTLGSDTIDGSNTSYGLSNSNAAVQFVSDGGTRWMTLTSPSEPFLGSTINLSAGTIVVSSLSFLDQADQSLQTLTISSGKVYFKDLLTSTFTFLNTAIGSNFSTLQQQFGVGSGLDLTVSSFRAYSGQTTLFTGSTITAREFVGDGSRLTNLYLPNLPYNTPAYSMFSISSGTSYTGEPWGVQVAYLSSLQSQSAPVSLSGDGYTLIVSSSTGIPFRVSYMCGGNDSTLATPRPTLTMYALVNGSLVQYPSVNNFEGGGGSISFIESFNSTNLIVFALRGLSNYTFSDVDSYLYRITFETIYGTNVDLLSTFNVWTGTNRYISSVQFYNGFQATGLADFDTINSSNGITDLGNLTVLGNTNLTFLSTNNNAIIGSNLSTLGNLGVGGSTMINQGLVVNGGLISFSNILCYSNILANSNIQADTYRILDYSTNTYRLLTLSTGALYADGTLIGAGGTGGGGVGGSTLSTLFLGHSSNQNTLQFFGRSGNYNTTVLSEQSTGTTSQELLFFKGSSVNDQIRLQTTGGVRFETGVSSRAFAGSIQAATPTMLINSSGNVGINTGTPATALDVAGTGRFTTVSSLNVYAGAIYCSLFFA